ncbi:MAG: TIGR03619 family F420-dependent LLM class oxidoreductase [Dehalococcoidia bacterium]|nr:TIGR03619 family F420-dependent LLM class oxidoreductase [Dehalococcoidia bacterium]
MASGKIPFGFALPQVSPTEPVDIAPIGHVARRAEELGFQSLWTLDQVLGGSRNLEPVSLLSYVAAITTRVRLGTAVFVLPQHNPVQLAKDLATLDVLSGGRVDAGFGIGNDNPPHDAAFGIPAGRRVKRMTESLAVMRALWSERKASYDGEFFQLKDIRMEPKPVQQPGPPVWFGGRVEPALRRAVRLGDAWMGPGSSSIDEFREHVAILRRALDEQARDPATYTLSKRLYLAIDDDRARAEGRLREWFAHVYGSADLANQVAVWGPASYINERIAEVIDIGAEHMLLHPVFDFDEHLDALAHWAS